MTSHSLKENICKSHIPSRSCRHNVSFRTPKNSKVRKQKFNFKNGETTKRFKEAMDQRRYIEGKCTHEQMVSIIAFEKIQIKNTVAEFPLWCSRLRSGGISVAVCVWSSARHSSDPTLLWLWCRSAATAPIRPLDWEPPYASGVALKDKKKKKLYDYQRLEEPYFNLMFFSSIHSTVIHIDHSLSSIVLKTLSIGLCSLTIIM